MDPAGCMTGGGSPPRIMEELSTCVFNWFSIRCFPCPCGVENPVVNLLETLWAYSGNIGSSEPSIISITMLIDGRNLSRGKLYLPITAEKNVQKVHENN